MSKDLVILLQNDDKDAFNALYWMYHAAIYANVLKLTRDIAITEDIVQEVFIALWEKRSQIDSEQGVAGWLFVVSYHKSINYLKLAIKQSIAQTAFHLANEDMTKHSDDLINAQIAGLEKAIEKLSPQKKKVFELCKLQRKTYQEAADELKLSKHTVKEYLSDAVISVKEFIIKHPEYSPLFTGSLFIQNFFYNLDSFSIYFTFCTTHPLHI